MEFGAICDRKNGEGQILSPPALNRVKLVLKKENTVNCGRMKTMEDVEMGKWGLTNEEINTRVKHEAF